MAQASDVSDRRLDAALWGPTPLGVSCPTGLLSEYVQRGSDYVYCAFRERDRHGIQDLRSAIEELYSWAGMPKYHGYSEQASSWLRVLDDPRAIRRYRKIESLLAGDEQYIAVVAVPEGAEEPVGFALAHPWRHDPSVAFGDYLWVGPRDGSGLSEDEYRTVQIGLWLRLIDVLVNRGFVALMGIMNIGKVRKVAVGSDAPFPIFRALGDELDDAGMLMRYEQEGRIPRLASFTSCIGDVVEVFELVLSNGAKEPERESEALKRIGSTMGAYRSRRLDEGRKSDTSQQSSGLGRLTLHGQILLDGLVTWAESWEVPARIPTGDPSADRLALRLGRLVEHIDRQVGSPEA